MEDVLKNSVRVTPSDKIRFKCIGCGECCRNVKASVPVRGIELPPHSESIPQKQAEEVSQDIMDMLDDLNLFNM